MNVLIINADDYGYSRAVNLGIIDSFKSGVLTSATLMANMPGFEHAVELAKLNPKFGIGVHLTLTCGKPLSENTSSLTENGSFKKIAFYESDFSIEKDELLKEWDLQIQRVIESGITPTHLDTHHHVNMVSPMKEVFIELARKFKLPVRNNFDVPDDLLTVKKFFIDFDDLGITKGIWKPLITNNLVQDCKNYHTVEAMCHPGYLDNVVFEGSSLLENRVLTTKELMDSNYKELFSANNIKLGTYRDLI
ncbi:carbohydrate deacetylase [Alkalibacterium sp. 20]|uniref:carbohydrate deacetylase n=1 Tax=Alkalibacterium sp. 20 TaxID=1798803 RepID=UPI0009003967|nr:carbohydrate deacetylase [Alkalibacterium sp. 20]OJF91893.1 hypothetical protein AX762_10430 [Alkalibacterium sp. 20]